MKALKWGLLGLIVSLIVAAAVNWNTLRFMASQSQMFLSPRFDSQPPELPELTGAIRILSFSKTNGYRHHDSIPAAATLLDELTTGNGWAIAHTENAAVFNAQQLAKIDVVVLNNPSGTNYTTDQQQAFVDYVESGGGVVALHAAGGDPSYEWPWYVNELIRAQFVDHPMVTHIQEATLHVEKKLHPTMQHITKPWNRSDEWYNFASSPRGRVDVLMTIDEASYDPEKSPMGGDHPMVWTHQVGDGRVFYSALGHVAQTYEEPNFKILLQQAIVWANQ